MTEIKSAPAPIQLLDHGIVELLDWMPRLSPADLRIVNGAQASFDKSSPEYTAREERILNSLIRGEHGVPLEHVVFTFRLRLPLFVAAQFKKHRMSSWSEQSGRYDELEPLFYIPERVRVQVGKPMDYTFEAAPEHIANDFRRELDLSYAQAWRTYERAIKLGDIAKEQARLVLPVATYTNVVWTMNLRALFTFLRLRVDPHAQFEARIFAEAMETLALEVAPDAVSLWKSNGRTKP